MGRKKRVLVVEDEILLGEVLCDLLAEAGIVPLGPAVDVDA
ncbi:MAG: response regulator, partial [Alphaproteobacteria bacterium]|nr:response regulator [Alphaproteobacteria bacterium]